jgi:FMN phosphatase YigB (HAD superfamily)
MSKDVPATVATAAAPLLRALHSQRVTSAVVTNNVVAEQQDRLRCCRLAPLVDVLVASDEAGVAKPDPAIFAIALDRVGCRVEAAVMVGDSWQVDIAGAQCMGLRAIWLNRDGLPYPDPTRAAAITALEPLAVVVALLLQGPHPHEETCQERTVSLMRRTHGYWMRAHRAASVLDLVW